MNEVELTQEDWDLLFPGEEFTLGKTKIKLRPVNVEDLDLIMKEIAAGKDYFVEKGITAKNYTEPLQLIALTVFLVERIPGLIAKNAGLTIGTVKNLPLTVAVDLIRALIQVNEKSKDGLIKNLKALADEMMTLMNKEPGDTGTSPKS